MMRTTVFLADLHGNLPATMAMARAIEALEPEEIWFLGDAVGKGPSNVETCDWVRTHCDHFVGGNWDYGIGGKEFSADGYFWNQLGEERLAWLKNLPREAEITLGGIRFRLFHGRPVTGLLRAQDDKAILSACFDNAAGHFDGVIFADSHRPFVRTLDCGYIINTGSIGVSMGVTRAHALAVHSGTAEEPLEISVLSVPYDNQAAAEAARRDQALPHADAYIREVLTGVYSRR